MPWNDDWLDCEDDDWLDWEQDAWLDWEVEYYQEELEEYRYWLDWADGVLNQDPEPGETREEVIVEEDIPPDLDLPEEDLEALAEASWWWGGLAGSLAELEREAGMFQEGRVRAKLHLLRFLLFLLPLPDDEPLLKVMTREDASSSPKAVVLTKGDLSRVVEGWLELYALDFPSQAYEEMKAFRHFLGRGVRVSYPALDFLLSAWGELWHRLEALKDPDLNIPPWKLPLVQQALRRRKQDLGRRFLSRELAPFASLLQESDDLYELVALEVFLDFVEE